MGLVWGCETFKLHMFFSFFFLLLLVFSLKINLMATLVLVPVCHQLQSLALAVLQCDV